MNRAIFLDRDGTLNKDRGYVHKFADWEWVPGALDALKIFKDNGWLLVVVSNQSGIGRGYYTEADLRNLKNEVDGELEKKGISIAAWYHCPHTDEDHCLCRKPFPGMVLQAARELSIDPAKSWMLGDRLRDVEAGLKAGCQAGLLYNPAHADEWQMDAKGWRRWRSLLECARDIAKTP